MRFFPQFNAPKYITKVSKASILGTLLIAGASYASAHTSSSFKTTVMAPHAAPVMSGPVSIVVRLSDDMVYRADHVSKDMRHRSASSSLNDGWTGHGRYGHKDLDRLQSRLKAKFEDRLVKQGFTIDDMATNKISLVIVDAHPNRPTFKQMSRSSLSHKSFGLGGASFEGTIISDGENIGDLSYAWYENDIREAQYSATWSDANRAIDRFARKTAKALK